MNIDCQLSCTYFLQPSVVAQPQLATWQTLSLFQKKKFTFFFCCVAGLGHKTMGTSQLAGKHCSKKKFYLSSGSRELLVIRVHQREKSHQHCTKSTLIQEPIQLGKATNQSTLSLILQTDRVHKSCYRYNLGLRPRL